jgi:nitrite reductase (NADH) large subunit
MRVNHDPTRVVVVGNGMVAHRFVDELVSATGQIGTTASLSLTVIGEEPQPAYDRIALSKLFEGAVAEDLYLGSPSATSMPGDAPVACELRATQVVAIDRNDRNVRTADGTLIAYDHLVLATGSRAFIPPVPGNDAKGCFVYRTISDCEAIIDAARNAQHAVVVGGGLLGLEAANALRLLGVDTEVVEFAPRLLAVQLDDVGASVLRREIEALGIRVRTGAQVVTVREVEGRAQAVVLGDGTELPADIVVFAAGVRPRDELARLAGLDVAERGGVVIDAFCRSSDPAVSAIGEVASRRGRCYGLVGPGYEMAAVLARRLSTVCDGNAAGRGEGEGEGEGEGGADTREGFDVGDVSTKLKLLGVEVASVGDIHRLPDDARSVVWHDEAAGVYQRIVVDAEGTTVLAAVLVGDSSPYGEILAITRGQRTMPPALGLLLGRAGSEAGVDAGATDPIICSCNGVARSTIEGALASDCTSIADLKRCTRAGASCGSCVPLLDGLLAKAEESRTGAPARRALCEHFRFTRSELFDIVAVRSITSFSELLAAVGTGAGCEVCKPTVASILASRSGGYILDGEQAALQDSNDHFLANLQRDGSYSVVPRIPAGEITPEGLIAIGEIARDFDLYTKITGGQRIDLFGAQIDDLPRIWERLIAHGFESGHAYGKALRTVKSCVGTTWCRYGQQDSVGFAVRVELRYRGLRAPHKIKMAVSGCARECAEARSKDVGLIATERGYNVYVCGNGGMTPQHALLLATDLSEDDALTIIDRVLMLYVRTAERLERTAPWFNRRFAASSGPEAGVEELRRIVIDDSLGLCSALDADMARHVESYACEWAETLADPARRARFARLVNAPADSAPRDLVATRAEPHPYTSDHTPGALQYVRIRGQRQPESATRLLLSNAAGS